MELSLWQLGLALLLVAVVLLVSIRERLGLERDLVVGAARTLAQLYAVGLVLAVVFARPRWYTVMAILVVMAAVAAHAAVSRLKPRLPGSYTLAALALGLSTAATLGWVIVQLPGMMTGQVLAGASPLVAIQYQIVVMFMQAAGSALASLLFIRLAARRYLTPAHQLRRELLVD